MDGRDGDGVGTGEAGNRGIHVNKISTSTSLPSRKSTAPKAAKLTNAARQWYHRIAIDLILRRKSLPPSKDGRRIPLRPDRGELLIDERRGYPYISNSIRTSRYTLYDFFPKQLFFQFTRLANFYFLCVGIPQTIPGVSTTGNFTTILPLLFFVLLTIAKEGYDDWRRHRLDKVENAKLTTVLRGGGAGRSSKGWRSLFGTTPTDDLESIEQCETVSSSHLGLQWRAIKWQDLQVGDVVKLARDDDVPADIVLLHAEGEEGLAYVETMALDGETNLKSKQVSATLEGCNSVEGLCSCGAEFVIEDPNPDLYRFDGRVTVNGETMPLTLNEVVYRGCTIRNTASVIGMVINTGEETKIRRNANRHPTAKKPALERMANMIVIALVLYLIALVAGLSGGYVLWQRAYERGAWYLSDIPVPLAHIIVGYAIQFNNVIPLALYVSLEIVKICQMLLLNSDIEMYDEVSDTPARCNTNTILENLGQVGYLFSDKTGTLTENVMSFRKLSVAGTAWLHEMDLTKSRDSLDISGTRDDDPDPEDLESKLEPADPPSSSARLSGFLSPSTPNRPLTSRRSSSQWRSTGRPDHVQPDLTTSDLLEYIRLRPNSVFSRRATQYILAMALCHTCLPETKDGKVDFQAASPDELALVRAARDLGFLVIQRTTQAVTLRITTGDSDTNRTYQILDVLEFSSKRKRMSIIVRCPDGRIWLLTKGADSAILPRLRMADLATQKAKELRESIDFEHQMLRKSEAQEPRNSFGGRPSLTIRRSLALGRQGSLAVPGSTSLEISRSKSFEVAHLDPLARLRSRPSLNARTTSLDARRAPSKMSSAEAEAVPSKFAFLEDPSLSDDAAIFTRCFRQIDDFATEGLRTLLFAHRFLGEQEYNSWKKLYRDAETSLVDRQDRIEATGEMIEQSLDLIGASGIEDQLQPGVAETIDRLRRANIKIWMLTGDKRETAINIAHSARICLPGSDIFVLDAAKGGLEGQILTIMEDLQIQTETNASGTPGHTVIVIDGHTLAALEEPTSTTAKTAFYRLILNIDSVICCRASPAQKALLVHAVRNASTSTTTTTTTTTPTTTNPSLLHHLHRLLPRWPSPTRPTTPLSLAIGDGANDLAMLSAAHVGVGISGREGLQAARVADYAVAQFRFLARLLLVHGRWNYARTARFVLATFWKEMLFYLPTALFQRWAGYTGTSLYEMWSLTALNTLFTSLCVVVPAVWEQQLAAETLLAVPELYVFGQRNGGLDVGMYLWWMGAAAAEGVLVWFLCWAVYGGTGPVRDGGLFALGDLVFSVMIVWTNLKLL